jgi:hypothetical protein
VARGDFSGMSCPTEESLKSRMLQAIHRQNLALDPGVNRFRAIGAKKMIQERADTKRALEQAEYSYNSHIASCEKCKVHSLPEWHVSEMKE